MILSKSCTYGIRALLYLTQQETTGFISINEISEKLNISFHFLTKIFQKLTKSNITNSFRGPAGGIELAKPAAKINLYDIVVAIEGPGIFSDCFFGTDDCENEAMCEIHDKWGKISLKINSFFKKTTLSKLTGKYDNF